MVRQLKVPAGFGASLPFGPAIQQSSPLALRDPESKLDDGSCDDARTLEELGGDYIGLISTIGKELCSVAGLDGRQAEARKGRADGVKFCWKPTLGDDTTGAAKTTSTSRSWRRTALWLAEVLHTKIAKSAEAARWRIRFYRHPKPDRAQASHEQLMSFKVFEDWRSCIQGGQLHSKPWLEMLKHVATKQAEKEEAAVQVANIRGYKPWVEGGAAGGLRRQHQFTRNATGWTETATGKGNHNELGEQDDFDGLSEEQVEAIRAKVGDTSSPADVQTEVNDQATSWKKVWGGNLEDQSDPEWPDDLGTIPKMMVVQALLAAATTFPMEAGLGWDSLHPRALNRLAPGTSLGLCSHASCREDWRVACGSGAYPDRTPAQG